MTATKPPDVQPLQLDQCRYRLPMTTRWMDNDPYGHVNNVVYYAYFDAAVNRCLIERGVLDFRDGPLIGLVVSTHCDYFASVAFPEDLVIGLRVAQIGRSSVHYDLGVYRGTPQPQQDPVAQGRFVHVYVDRVSRRPVSLPDPMRAVLQSLC
jgi:acyl-CoA thioester hydrolase